MVTVEDVWFHFEIISCETFDLRDSLLYATLSCGSTVWFKARKQRVRSLTLEKIKVSERPDPGFNTPALSYYSASFFTILV